jgi:hypothetical protein
MGCFADHGHVVPLLLQDDVQPGHPAAGGTGKVISMASMFTGASAFNQFLCWPHDDPAGWRYDDMWSGAAVGGWGTADTCFPPTTAPTKAPSKAPTTSPSRAPTSAPSKQPSSGPSPAPSRAPTAGPSARPTSLPAPIGASATPTAQVSTGAPTSKVVVSTTKPLFGGKGAMNINVLDLATDAVQMQLSMTVPGGFNGFVSFGVTTGAKAHATGSRAIISFPVNGVYNEPALFFVLPNNTVAPAIGRPRLQEPSPFCHGRPDGVQIVGTTLAMSLCGDVNTFGGGLGLGKMAATGTLIAAFSPSSGADLSVAHLPQQVTVVTLTPTAPTATTTLTWQPAHEPNMSPSTAPISAQSTAPSTAQNTVQTLQTADSGSAAAGAGLVEVRLAAAGASVAVWLLSLTAARSVAAPAALAQSGVSGAVTELASALARRLRSAGARRGRSGAFLLGLAAPRRAGVRGRALRGSPAAPLCAALPRQQLLRGPAWGRGGAAGCQGTRVLSPPNTNNRDAPADGSRTYRGPVCNLDGPWQSPGGDDAELPGAQATLH